MNETAKLFIGKDCIIYTVNAMSQLQGIIKEVSGNSILVEYNNSIEAINLDYVIRIREYPRNKKGKKKAIIGD